MSKSILPKDILDKIGDIMESKFIKNNNFYSREGSVFSVAEDESHLIQKYQIEANEELLLSGELTVEMLMEDLNNHIKTTKDNGK